MSTPSLTRRLWLAFALMAALTLLSTVIGWISLRVISQVEQTNTQALLPTMNMARQLSEASAYELFSAQNLTNADSESVWLAQGKMLKAQSLKINHLLQALSEQGFNTSAIARQEKEIAQTLGQQGTLVGEILTLRAQQQQLSRQIAEAAESIAAQAHGQANNAATSAGATQAGIYDLIESGKGDQAERALDRLIDIDLEYVNQMNELRVNALRFKQLIVTLKDAQGLSDAEDTDEKLNQLVKILSRRQQRIEDPTVRAQIADALEKINQYTTLVTLFRKENAIRDQLQTLMANNLFQFTRFSTEVSQLVNAIEKRNEAGLARLTHASQRGQIGLVILGILALCSLSFILWRVVYRSVSRPLAQQTQALQRLLEGDIDSPFPEAAGVSELDTISRLMEAFRANVRKLNRHREDLAEQVRSQTAELHALVLEHRQARAEAEKANEAKSTFLAAMSHEIRTPLYGILGTVQLLADKPLMANYRDDLQAINDSGESLLAILNDILDYSAIEVGGTNVSISEEPFEPRQLLNSALHLMHSRVQVALITDFSEQLPSTLQGDPRRIRQIVINLLSNAAKFTDRGSIVLRTFCDDQSWFIEVEDTGCGIPEAKLTAIFKPFVQATGRRGGTGLGLAISASLAEAMGGTLTVTSTLHVGSCFRLQLPVRHPRPASKNAFREPINLNGLRLLLIEDNMLTQRITAEMLTGKGVKVSVAESANDALRCLAEGESFDVALVDFDLPDYDGLTLAQQLMSQYPAMKRIGFSAHVIDDNLRQRTAGLFCGIIQKPVPREELYRMIAHYLQGKSHNARAMLNEHQLAGDMASVGPEKLRQWVALFKDSALPLVEEIEAARAMNDDVNIKRLAHKLKSGCASLGMTQATEACRELELQPLSDIDIKTIVTQGVTALDAWIAGHPSP
ncbi:TPA_asm: TMAO reductase system sensor histidine kinase/response regulator TorS [Salmonella enterica subsp. enterica serovar Cerro]|nr:TMAO reductase system sensor histidine kinase/response regulator TorS [Salmonella enterica subsp. enterica serovar Cerro]HAE3298147.1 TMAO reductase system sensor histidine kinase/response regulator TorS [Salmonella enterica subsp. enterica serovar Cerro]